MSPSLRDVGGAGEHDGAGEVGDERRRGRRGELGGGALLDDAAAVDHADAVAEQRGLGEVVRDEQGRHARLGQHRGQLAPARGARARVERGERLVEQQRRGAARERAGDGDALALAARERPRALVGEVGDAEAVQQLERAPAALGAVEAAQRIGDVLPCPQVGEQRVLLEDVAAAPPLGRDVDAALGVEPHLLAAGHAPAVRVHEAGRDAQHRGLAGARRPGEREAGAGRDLERDVERERPEPRGGLNAQHRRATPSRSAA